MNVVVDGLRQTSKGQLVYNREIGGKTLTTLLHKCASVPALSCPHTEITPPRHSISFGLSYDDKEEKVLDDMYLDDHQYNKDMVLDCNCGLREKGEQDSLEKENSCYEQSTDKADPLHGPPQSLHDVSPRHSHTVHHTSSQTVSSIGPQFSSSDHPQLVCPKHSQVFSSKTAQIVSPKSPQVMSPKSPQLASKKNPQDVSQQSSNAESPNSPQDVVSDRGEETTEDTTMDDLTVSFTEKLHAITSVELDYDNRSKEVIEKKQKEFLVHQTHLDSWREESVSSVQQRHFQHISQLHDTIEKQQQSKRPEMQQAVQKVKEAHQQCSRRQDARQKQVEQLSQHLKEEQAKREQALDQKLEEVRAMARKITSIKTTLGAALDQCPHKQHLSEVGEKTRLLVRKLSEQAEGLAGSLTRSGPLDEMLAKLKQFHEQSQNALDFVHNLTAEAERKAKAAAAAEAERQKQQAAAAQAQQAQGPSTPQGTQTSATAQPLTPGEEGALSAVAKEYEINVKLLSQMNATLDPFISDQQMKKIRFDLQRAVNTPVNAISPVSSDHLRDKLLRLRSLLKGETVDVQGKQVTANVVPQGLTFCKNLIAKMLAKKADEQVSSNHESAFAIAAVAVGLWAEFPEMGELIMAHLQALCPYVLPFYPPRLPNQTLEEYHRTLGYKIVDGNIEQQDKFLRRMSGILRLYAAILVTSPPQGANHPHPHGLEHAWVWLTRSMNLQPNPDITATAIYDMLQVTGSFLLRAYRVQFAKLIYFLQKGFLPKLKDVAAGSGPVIRLETFLETTMKNSALIPEPDGYLSPRFWQT